MYSITLTNPFGVQIDLQVNVGSKAACDANGLNFNGPLGPNASYTVETDQNVVCWRRTAEPDNPGGPLGQWTSFFPTPDNTPANYDL